MENLILLTLAIFLLSVIVGLAGWWIYLCAKPTKILFRGAKNYIQLWKNPETRKVQKASLKENAKVGIVIAIALLIIGFTVDLWNQHPETILGIGIVALYGIWKILKYGLIGIGIYFLVRSLLDFFAERVAHHMKK